MNTVLVIGEALIDVLPTPGGGVRELPGGSSANVSVALGRLGRRAILATTLADDAHGAAVRRWLKASGVEVVAQQPATGRTSTAAVLLADDGSASYDFDLTWDLSSVTLGAAMSAAEPAVVHAGSIATVLEPGADAVEKALHAARGKALVTFDPNARPAITPELGPVLERVERLVAASDLVKVSEEDLAWYYPGAAPVEVATKWAESGATLVIVTLGEHGSVTVRRNETIEVPAVQVAVADTIGAGDTFMGALIDALTDLGAKGEHATETLAGLPTEALREAIARAARAAAITVSRPGADPPTKSELA